MLMTKTTALVHVCVIVLIVGFSTYHLFLGNFELSMTALPLLMGYYVFITARRKKKESSDESDTT
jgi:hypothetical protein